MGDEPEQDEVGIDFAVEHGFEVEFQEGLPRERLVVAQDAEGKAVGDDGPKVGGAAVEKLLNEAVRIGLRCAANTGSATVEAYAAADEMDGGVTGKTADGVGLAVNGWGGAGGEETEAEFAQQRERPFIVGEAGGGVAFGSGEWREAMAKVGRGLGTAARNSAQCRRRRFQLWVMASVRRSPSGRP